MGDSTQAALRDRAREFIASDAFEIHFKRKHPARWLWTIAIVVTAIQQRSLRRLIGGLFRPSRVFASKRLRRRYSRLVETGRIVRVFFVMENPALWSQRAIAPALMLASLDGTEAADREAQRIASQICDVYPDDEPVMSPVVTAVRDILREEEYRPCRKRKVPTEIVTCRDLHVLDVLVDNALRDSLFSDSSNMYFVVDPSRKGLLLQIPEIRDRAESACGE